MAYETGTASDYVDLYTKLHTFLTGAALGTQAWTQVWGASAPFSAWDQADPAASDASAATDSDILLRGPGISGTDEVYLSFRLYINSTNDIHGIQMRGHDGLVDTAVNYAGHINPSPYMFAPLLGGPMPYWFVANGRRFVAVIKTSTNYSALHGGLIRPFATPSGYPYPIAVGGNLTGIRRWSDGTYINTHFVNPGPRDSPDQNHHAGASGGRTLRVRLPSGEWRAFRNNHYGTYLGQVLGHTFPWRTESTDDNFARLDRPLLGGGYLLTPVALLVNDSSSSGNVRGALGALEGVFHVAGFSNYAENTITVTGKTYLVVQNAFRTGYEDYWALLLE